MVLVAVVHVCAIFIVASHLIIPSRQIQHHEIPEDVAKLTHGFHGRRLSHRENVG